MSPIEPRPLTSADLDWVVEVTRRRRESLEPHAPRFWRPAADTTARHRDFLVELVDDPGTLGARTEHGYLIALDRGAHALVDDMVVASEHWATDGVALLQHAQSAVGALRFVVPAFEGARLDAAYDVGLAPVETWWHRDLDPVAAGTDVGDAIEVPGARGRLVPAPPVYDPGGSVLLVTEVDSAEALVRIERAAAARGAVVSVVSRRPDTEPLGAQGYTLTTYFCS
ncbi:MAG: hypothetical protein ACR2JD_04440 [Nocardioides sp.]